MEFTIRNTRHVAVPVSCCLLEGLLYVIMVMRTLPSHRLATLANLRYQFIIILDLPGHFFMILHLIEFVLDAWS